MPLPLFGLFAAGFVLGMGATFGHRFARALTNRFDAAVDDLAPQATEDYSGNAYYEGCFDEEGTVVLKDRKGSRKKGD
jgi:hypothetical protein